jgi:hypothetical protein
VKASLRFNQEERQFNQELIAELQKKKKHNDMEKSHLTERNSLSVYSVDKGQLWAFSVSHAMGQSLV